MNIWFVIISILVVFYFIIPAIKNIIMMLIGAALLIYLYQRFNEKDDK